jgi:predicted Zn-dependent peptidase
LLVSLAAACAPIPPAETPVAGLTLPARDPTPRPLEDDDPREKPPETEASAAAALPEIRRERLGSGVELVVAAATGPRVEVRLVIRGAGSDADGGAPGLAALALRLCLEGGTMRLSGKDFSARLAALGVELSWSLRRDAAVISASIPGGSARDGLALLLQALREPRLDAAELARVRRLERGAAPPLSSPERWLLEIERQELLQGAGGGTVEATLDRIGAAELRAFARDHLAPGALSVVLVGEPDSALRGAVEQATSGWKATATPAATRALAPRRERHRILLVDQPQSTVVGLWLLAPGPSAASEDWPSFQLLAELLGGAPTARLPLALQGPPPLAAAPRVELLERGVHPWFWLRAVADPARVVGAVGAVLDTIRKAPEAPGSAEFQGAQRRALSRLRGLVSAPRTLADELAKQAALGLDEGATARQVERLAKVDAAKLPEAARAHLGGGLLVLVAGDAAQLAPGLQRHGEVVVIDPTRGFEPARVLPEARGDREKEAEGAP